MAKAGHGQGQGPRPHWASPRELLSPIDQHGIGRAGQVQTAYGGFCPEFIEKTKIFSAGLNLRLETQLATNEDFFTLP